MAGEIEYSDLLDLRAEGCYNLEYEDMLVYESKEIKKNGTKKTVKVVKQDADHFYEWDFSKVKNNLEKAKKPRTVRLNLGKGKTVAVECKLAKDIVPDYVWQDVSDGAKSSQECVLLPSKDGVIVNVDSLNDNSVYAYDDGNYKKALSEAEIALKNATTNKQHGAAYYNMGMSYMAMHKYRRAKDCFEQSDAVNPTKAAKDQINLAQEGLQEKRGKAGKFALVAGLLGAGAVYGGRKYYLMRQKNFGRRR